MAADPTTPRSRRAVLTGAFGGLLGLAVHAVARPLPVRAEGEAIVVGGEYTTATSVTRVRNEANINTVFRAESAVEGVALDGHSPFGKGVRGTAPWGIGVEGISTDGHGVSGSSVSSIGVAGGGGTIGVSGGSLNGIGGYFAGGKAQLRLEPKGSRGKPASGSHSKGEIYMDSRGSLFVCTAGGTPGTWKKIVTKLV